MSSYSRMVSFYHISSINISRRHQTKTWTNVDLSSVRFSDNHLMAVSQEIPQAINYEISLKIPYVKFHSNRPGASEFKRTMSVQCNFFNIFVMTFCKCHKCALLSLNFHIIHCNLHVNSWGATGLRVLNSGWNNILIIVWFSTEKRQTLVRCSK